MLRILFAGAVLAGIPSACATGAAPVGVIGGDPLSRLHVHEKDLRTASERDEIRFVGKSRYLNHSRAVVTHTIDDSTRFVPASIDAMDRHGIKATIFVSTERGPISELWPRLRQAVANGHEIGSHSRTHRCQWPGAADFCKDAYSESEIGGSRDDILRNAGQPYVWSWCYPCGLCAGFDFIQDRIRRAGYLVARNYPREAEDGHLVPNVQTWDSNPYNAGYTQVAQRKGGIAKSGRTDVVELNAKFDEVHRQGGIYNLMSHPQWLDLGPEGFYEQHLAHIGGRADVWYVPMGPLYGYHTVSERTEVRPLAPAGAKARFAVYNDLDPRIYNMSLTLEFAAPGVKRVFAGRERLLGRKAGPTDRWNEQYFRRDGDTLYVTVQPNTILEFR